MLDPFLIQVISVIAIAVALLSLLIFIARRIRRVPPNEALVIVGRGAGRASPESAHRPARRDRRPHLRLADPAAGLLDLPRAAPDRHHGRGRRQEPHQDRDQGVDQLQGQRHRGRRAPRGAALPLAAGAPHRDHQGVARGIAAFDRRRHDDRADHLRPQEPLRPRRGRDEDRPRRAGPPGRPAEHLRHLDARQRLPRQPRSRRGGPRPPGRRGQRGRGGPCERVRAHRGGRADRRAPEGPQPQAGRDQGRDRPCERRGRGRGPAREGGAGQARRRAGARRARRSRRS